jgi:hypothetical protein
VRLIVRPIDQWPGEFTKRRQGTDFTASWSDTVALLAREVEHLAGPGAQVVLQAAIGESDCRLDGWIRANARPTHPGVILSFESRRLGPLRYHTDRFEGQAGGYTRYLPGWQSNVRAIALGLEALRKVDRYGIATAGEQYRGWQALPPGAPVGEMTVEEAARFIAEHGNPTLIELGGWANLASPGYDLLLETTFRAAAKNLHPDRGGDPALFRRLTEARQIIEENRD